MLGPNLQTHTIIQKRIIITDKCHVGLYHPASTGRMRYRRNTTKRDEFRVRFPCRRHYFIFHIGLLPDSHITGKVKKTTALTTTKFVIASKKPMLSRAHPKREAYEDCFRQKHHKSAIRLRRLRRPRLKSPGSRLRHLRRRTRPSSAIRKSCQVPVITSTHNTRLRRLRRQRSDTALPPSASTPHKLPTAPKRCRWAACLQPPRKPRQVATALAIAAAYGVSYRPRF